MDLVAFYAAYREDGRSRPAYEPSMMVALRKEEPSVEGSSVRSGAVGG
jgi:hypothetical protein